MANNDYVNKVEYGNETLIDITSTTAEEGDVIEGKSFFLKSGAPATGTLGDATTSTHGLMSAADKTKLNGITAAAAVTDVQMNSTSILSNGIANIPIATDSNLGVVSNGGMGIGINSSGHLYLNYATDNIVKTGTSVYNAITASHQHEAAFYGLAKAAGDSTQAASSNAVGNYTDDAKAAIRSMLGVTITDVQINSTSILSNGVANIPLASGSTFGVVKVGYGLYYADGVIYTNAAGISGIKAAESYYTPIVPVFQHASVFYGLAKAAGDTTQAASSNAVGVYTDTAKAAIQSMLSVAPTANPIFTGSFSHNRKASTTVGTNSFAAGDNCEASAEDAHAVGRYTTASGAYSHAEGNYTTASGMAAHAEGTVTVANHANQHVFGEYNVADASDANVWSRGNYIEIVGNGTASNATSNARALDWAGNEYLDGDLYVNCSANSTNGYKVIADINNSITIGSTTITESQLQALLATLQ